MGFRNRLAVHPHHPPRRFMCRGKHSGCCQSCYQTAYCFSSGLTPRNLRGQSDPPQPRWTSLPLQAGFVKRPSELEEVANSRAMAILVVPWSECHQTLPFASHNICFEHIPRKESTIGWPETMGIAEGSCNIRKILTA